MSHWRPGTRRGNRAHYGPWLGWLDRAGHLCPAAAPAERVSEAAIGEYCRYLTERYAPRTVASAIIGLKCVLRRIAPDHDWKWLAMLGYRLDSWAEPRVDRS